MDEIIHTIITRHSVRSYRKEPVPAQLLEQMIDAARYAPSGRNEQPWEFVVVKDLELKKGIKQIVDEYRRHDYFQMEATREPWEGERWAPMKTDEFMLTEGPVYILVCGDERTKLGLPMIARLCKQKGDSIWESTLSNAYHYMLLAATSLGLGAHYVSSVKVPQVQGLIKHLLGIPRFLEIYDMMALGYPAYEPKPRLVREKGEMVHYGQYNAAQYRSDKEIRDFIVSLQQWRAR